MLESDEISSESDRLPIELIERDLLINSDDTMLVCVQEVNWLHQIELSLHSTNEIDEPAANNTLGFIANTCGFSCYGNQYGKAIRLNTGLSWQRQYLIIIIPENLSTL